MRNNASRDEYVPQHSSLSLIHILGQSLVVVETAKYIEAHPDATVDEIFAFTNSVMDRVLLGFVPTDLAFLKAGGRLSNVAFLGAHLLKIKPCIEVTGGKFVATKKFRGSMLKCARAFICLLYTSIGRTSTFIDI